MTQLIQPHGGELKDLYLSPAHAQQEKLNARHYVSWDLSERQVCDIELLLNGSFSPLTGFMAQVDYESVLDRTRLANNIVWPMPITLDVSEAFATTIKVGEIIALRDMEGTLIATLKISDMWRPDKAREAIAVYGADDLAHPGVSYLHNVAGTVYIGGPLSGVDAPVHYDYKQLRDTPAEMRAKFVKWGWNKVVAFQTRNPMHRAHQELTFRAAQQAEANLLIHPVVGMTKPGDIDHYSRVRCYQHVLDQYPSQTTMLSLLGLAMRMAGPREAVWHAIIRKNHGCTHFIVGRDHAGPGKNSHGKDFYGPYDAQELVQQYQEELEIKMVPFQEMLYIQERAEYQPMSDVKPGETVLNISGTEFRRRLMEGLDIPEWFSYKDVVAELRRTHPPKHRQGFTVFFTGLSGAGKSTIANALLIKLLEIGTRPVTLLDGDVVRKNLSSELGFSREHRNMNILRVGYVASEITKNGGAALCAAIAPYASTRAKVRESISAIGGFLEVYVSTSIEVCEIRDRKGLYAKARAGLIHGFTGVNDPYEVPTHPELSINTNDCSVDEAAQRVLLKLENLGYIRK